MTDKRRRRKEERALSALRSYFDDLFGCTEDSDLTIMLTMLRLYKENRIAVVDYVDGELCAFTVREYVNMVMEKC